MTENRLKVLLADDQALVTDSLRTYLENYAKDIEVVGIAATGREAVSLADTLLPDIILMDILMPELNGIEALKLIRQKHPEMKIIILSTYDEDEYVNAAISSGAQGYLLKAISPTELITAIRVLRNNIIQMSPQIAQHLVQQKYNGKNTQNGGGGVINGIKNLENSLEWLDTLTNREREIFTLLAVGYDNEHIAKKLCIAPQTAKNHISVIYSKLGVKDRFEIIRLANQK